MIVNWKHTMEGTHNKTGKETEKKNWNDYISFHM